ncbi:hypothetical protein DYB34_013408 [Aphanomyces astaci]|uniref:Uncharacterized protein n=1 Tax=Aphanomyces astaci TaxID=112090 RepID=A0A397FV01_APHAT|nr:hypothetical protein DYB34_013408 [Aphanomyces astaci]RHZ38603.1 hypothetical protein DYB31_008948 [Aphanomyces astaci]
MDSGVNENRQHATLDSLIDNQLSESTKICYNTKLNQVVEWVSPDTSSLRTDDGSLGLNHFQYSDFMDFAVWKYKHSKCRVDTINPEVRLSSHRHLSCMPPATGKLFPGTAQKVRFDKQLVSLSRTPTKPAPTHHARAPEMKIPKSHPIFYSRVFTDVNMVPMLKVWLVTHDSVLPATGIPPHVSLHKELTRATTEMHSIPNEVIRGVDTLVEVVALMVQALASSAEVSPTPAAPTHCQLSHFRMEPMATATIGQLRYPIGGRRDGVAVMVVRQCRLSD